MLRRYILFLVVIYLIYICLDKYPKKEPFTNLDENEYFERLMSEFRTIFPSNNRNAGGVQFYHHIVTNMNPTIAEFNIYNRLYCGVSGSPIDPRRENAFNYTVLRDLNDNLIYGKYHRCCTPCVCDIMKYAKTEQHTVTLSDGEYTHNVITINDPCTNESDIPDEVSSFICENNSTTNGIRTSSGRLVICVLYEAQPYDVNNQEMNQNHSNNESMCEERNSLSPDELRGGMGDIFVRLSLIGNSNSEVEPFGNNEDTGLLNIYGEPLQRCQLNDNDRNGSWDNEGYCSEVGGGVHQLCFNVNNATKDFAEDTDQGSNWSLNRVNNNHCMCLGAWSLYKAKQDNDLINQTEDELICSSIPEMSLNTNYINNWNTWNGNELPNQIIEGVNHLIDQCYLEGNPQQRQYLKNKYLELVEEYPSFRETEIYEVLLNSER
jgi:hypothetical protein